MNKLKLSELSRPEFEVSNFEHPTHGELDGWVKMRGTDNDEYFFKAVEMAEMPKDAPMADLMKLNAELLSTLIVDWDQEFFEMECTPENVVNVFSQVKNLWLRNHLFSEVDKQSENFTTAKENVKTP